MTDSLRPSVILVAKTTPSHKNQPEHFYFLVPMQILKNHLWECMLPAEVACEVAVLRSHHTSEQDFQQYYISL